MVGILIAIEHSSNIGEDRLRLIEVLMGHAPDLPSQGLQSSIASPVGLEGGIGRMLGSSVEFDDHPILRPETVGFDQMSSDVDQNIQFGLPDVRPREH